MISLSPSPPPQIQLFLVSSKNPFFDSLTFRSNTTSENRRPSHPLGFYDMLLVGAFSEFRSFWGHFRPRGNSYLFQMSSQKFQASKRFKKIASLTQESDHFLLWSSWARWQKTVKKRIPNMRVEIQTSRTSVTITSDIMISGTPIDHIANTFVSHRRKSARTMSSCAECVYTLNINTFIH